MPHRAGKELVDPLLGQPRDGQADLLRSAERYESSCGGSPSAPAAGTDSPAPRRSTFGTLPGSNADGGKTSLAGAFRLILSYDVQKIEKRPVASCHLDRLAQGAKRPQKRSRICLQMRSPPQAESIFYMKRKLSLIDSTASPKTSGYTACTEHTARTFFIIIPDFVEIIN